jgi:hypothetical protein
VPWELILVDNTILKKGITEVYNTGAAQAKYDILCFVHEDVLFRTNDWGRKIAGYFENDADLGLVGVAGSKYKSRAYSGWFTGLAEMDCSNIFHMDRQQNEQRIYSNPDGATSLVSTVTTDGVFICTSKRAWKEVRFNDQLLKGFHLYDIDFSFSVSMKYKVAVTYEIDIVHLTTGGDFGNVWIDETIKWHNIHFPYLPKSIADLPADIIFRNERIIKKNWLRRLKGEKISFRNRLRWTRGTKAYQDLSLWPHIFTFLVFGTYKKFVP